MRVIGHLQLCWVSQKNKNVTTHKVLIAVPDTQLISSTYYCYCYTTNSTVAATTSTTQYDPLLLPLVLVVLLLRWAPTFTRSSTPHFSAMTAQQPAFWKRGQGSTSCTLCSPQAWPSWMPSRKCYWGWTTVKSTLHPTLHKAVQYLSGQCLSKAALCPTHLSTLWYNGQSSSDISENTIPQDHPVPWELTDSLSLQLSWADFTCPAAHCPQCPSVQHSL